MRVIDLVMPPRTFSCFVELFILLVVFVVAVPWRYRGIRIIRSVCTAILFVNPSNKHGVGSQANVTDTFLVSFSLIVAAEAVESLAATKATNKMNSSTKQENVPGGHNKINDTHYSGSNTSEAKYG